MAETQEATVGYMGEFHLSTDAIAANLEELVQVQEFDIPEPGAREQVENTHLKTLDWRRTYLETFYEDSDFEVVLNSRPLSDTDVLLAAALAAGDERAFKAVIPEDGAPASQVTGTAKVMSYKRGRVSKDGLLTATATLRIMTIDAIAAYSA